ncbi:lytic transglycosylase domain-containing protein, partial [Kitasatospora sp. NPDC097691]
MDGDELSEESGFLGSVDRVGYGAEEDGAAQPWSGGAHREAAQESSSRRASSEGVSGSAGFSPGRGPQFQCFSQIVKRESGWDYTATNKSSGAYGLV